MGDAPITRTEMEACWNTWVVCHLPMEQWVLNQRRLNDNVGADTAQVNARGGPQTSYATGNGGANIPGELALQVDIGSNATPT